MILRKLLEQRAEAQSHFMARQGRYGMEEYVLEKGVVCQSSEPLTDEQYDYLLRVTNGVQCLPKQCFYNAQMIAFYDYLFQGRDESACRVKYHEGYYFSGLMPILHAWVTIDDKIVDVTLSTDEDSVEKFYNGIAPQADLKDRVLGVIPQGWEYLGVVMSSAKIADMLETTMRSVSLIDDWENGWPLLQR